jgi:hypothetical protein
MEDHEYDCHPQQLISRTPRYSVSISSPGSRRSRSPEKGQLCLLSGTDQSGTVKFVSFGQNDRPGAGNRSLTGQNRAVIALKYPLQRGH